MLDNLRSPDDRPEPNRDKATNESRSAPLSDREVPIDRHRTPAAIHAWLDGELSESEVRRGDMVRDVDFWNRLGEQVDTRRQMRTPAHVQTAIMSAITAEQTQMTPEWAKRPTRMSTTTMLLAAAGLLAIGAAIGALLLRS
jgi:hypothetical protein